MTMMELVWYLLIFQLIHPGVSPELPVLNANMRPVSALKKS